MTQPPYGPQQPAFPPPVPPSYGPGYGAAYSSGYASTATYERETGYDAYGLTEGPAPDGTGTRPRRTRRRIAIGATVVGALVVGGGGFAVAAYLSGGGAQPEDVLPADTMAFVKLDLDPAMGQKTAVANLLDKFPALGDGTDDIRQGVVDRILELGDTRLSYEEDVEPWLGDRMAAAVVPDETSQQGWTPVVVLAVDDQQAMGDALGTLADDAGFGYAVRDDFVLVTEEQETADRLAAEESRLAEDDDYVADLAALEGDQLAVAWADLSAVQQLVSGALEQDGIVTLDESFAQLSGRVIYGLHAEDDALELVGMDFTVSDVGPGPRPTEPSELVQQLPEDTLAAVSASGAGDVAADSWAEFEKTGMLDGVEEMFPDLEMPADLQSVLGSEFAVAVFGDLQNPQFGVRAVTDDPERGADILRGFNYAFDLGIRTVPAAVDDGYVLGTDVTTARALAGEDAGLGDTPAFRAAVPGADEATVIGYADLAALLEQVPADDGFDPADFEALESLGFSSTPTDEGSRAVLRITTR